MLLENVPGQPADVNLGRLGGSRPGTSFAPCGLGPGGRLLFAVFGSGWGTLLGGRR